MNPMLNIAVRAARAAGDVIVRRMDRLDTLDVAAKSRNDFVTDVDRDAEAAIIGVIRRAYPAHAILAEESGGQAGDEEYCWIIDPLDGTTNYMHGFPHFAISIALAHRGRLEQGVIFDPVRHELFTASRGAGARLDDRRIRVAGRGSLKGALLGTGFPFRKLEELDLYMQTLHALIPRTAGVRRAGSAALDLAYVAAGRLDGFWEFGLEKWDIAAGVLMIREAGGMVADRHGGEDYYESGDVLAGNPRVLRELVRVVRPLCLSRRS